MVERDIDPNIIRLLVGHCGNWNHKESNALSIWFNIFTHSLFLSGEKKNQSVCGFIITKLCVSLRKADGSVSKIGITHQNPFCVDFCGILVYVVIHPTINLIPRDQLANDFNIYQPIFIQHCLCRISLNFVHDNASMVLNGWNLLENFQYHFSCSTANKRNVSTYYSFFPVQINLTVFCTYTSIFISIVELVEVQNMELDKRKNRAMVFLFVTYFVVVFTVTSIFVRVLCYNGSGNSNNISNNSNKKHAI